ncbi:MAG: PAS domain-containing protein [Magnetococcales bacterium]|nr:PAS domain-containing protein [Magnetococcales bacterium]NGZ27103.1 PAS domain-containing protein [Magnetococcales bacterium]
MSDSFSPTALMDNLPTGILAADREGVVRLVNATAERMMGKPRRHLLGNRISQLLPGHPVAIDLMERALRLVTVCRSRNAQLNPSPGINLSVSITAAPLLEGEGEPVGVILHLEEVGSAEKLEEGERLSQTLDSLSSLALAVAHEVKNPLSGIRGAGQLLESEVLSPSGKECLNLIQTEVDRVSRLLDSLLGLADTSPPGQQEINIHEVLDHVLRLCGYSPPLPVRDYDPSLPLLTGHWDQLVQLFLNLVKNAREAVGEKGEVRVHTRMASQMRLEHGRRKRHVTIEIRDNGPGIPWELRQRIFMPFVTTKAGGSGLGLSICQKIVHDHGGLIELDSQPGQTIFRIFLPLPSLD